MSKVLFLVNHEVVIYNFRLELVERLLQDGHDVVISSPPGERINDLVALGCRFCPVELSRHGTNPLQDLKLLASYRKLLKEEKPDIVFTYTIKPNIYGGMACASANVPYVVNITGLGTAVEHDGLMQKLTSMLYRYALRKVQRVYFQNEENRQFFAARKLAVEKHGMLPGSGVNLQRFSILPYPSDDTVEFVFISRIMQEKGIDQYLEAAEYIREKYPHTRFHICGFCEEAYEARLREMQEKQTIIYHGMVRDIKKVIEQTHCTVHPTYYPEGLSNVLLESAACARPLITTNRSGCREVVDDGVNGFLTEQKNAKELIEKIERFLSLSWEERKQMGLCGRAKVEKEFDRRIVVEKYVQELEEALNR